MTGYLQTFMTKIQCSSKLFWFIYFHTRSIQHYIWGSCINSEVWFQQSNKPSVVNIILWQGIYKSLWLKFNAFPNFFGSFIFTQDLFNKVINHHLPGKPNYLKIFLSFTLFHWSTAFLKSRVSILSPSMSTIISLCTIDALMRFRWDVLIKFCTENPRSTSAL